MTDADHWQDWYTAHVEPLLLYTLNSRATSDKPPLERVFERIPKTDLHSHLNGSISASLLSFLEKQLRSATVKRGSDGGGDKSRSVEKTGEGGPGKEEDVLFFDSASKRSANVLSKGSSSSSGDGAALTPKERMLYCFKVFDNVYRVMTCIAFTRLAVQDMLFSNAAEAVLVLEIRSSLRDGMLWRRTASTSAAGANTGTSSKKDYVEAILTTVEHVLSGGLVDFDSGELVRPSSSASVCSGAPSAQWWDHFKNIYGYLLPSTTPASIVSSTVEDGGNAANEAFKQLYTRLRHHLTHAMHVRVVLSINRGSPVGVGEEAVDLAKAMQQHQVLAFYQWCVRHCRMRGSTAATGVQMSEKVVMVARVLQKLRRTCWVTGIDFSGNCYKGNYVDFEPALCRARSEDNDVESSMADIEREERKENYAWNLPCPSPAPPVRASITMHGGEKQDERELSRMCDFRPDRWGHLVFTDEENLARILAAHDGIELCITSNLLTSGHDAVPRHHLSDVWALWKARYLTIQQGTGGGEGDGGASGPQSLLWMLLWKRENVYAASEKQRLRWRYGDRLERKNHREGGRKESSALCDGDREVSADDVNTNTVAAATAPFPFAIPNISFHTDDRGVFGTTAAHELFLATQHPALCSSASDSDANASESLQHPRRDRDRVIMKAMWGLQRLSLIQVFEVPMPVLLLASYLTGGAVCVTETGSMREGALSSLSSASHPLSSIDWQDWHQFVTQCNVVLLGNEEMSKALRRVLSEWEWQTLTRCFDTYAICAGELTPLQPSSL